MKFVYRSGSRPLQGYTIRRGVGAGGFGEVYFATSDAGKEVALKRIQRNLEVELRGVGHCLNLKHPNLVDLYDIRYDDDGEAWVVMEYVSGESLKDVLDRHPQGLSNEQVMFWFQGIAAAVAYLHNHGIVHRDLKPGNVFLDGNTVKIGDYGLSKFISCSRRSGQTESVGTFHYMAPEIGKGVYGKEIDIYALGVMLYELLTGGVPFDGESSQEIIMKHLTASPDLSALPPQYRDTIRNALKKDPAQRFSDVSHMLRSIQQASSGRQGASWASAAAAVAASMPQPPLRQDVMFLDGRETPAPPMTDAVPGIAFGPLRTHGPESAQEIVKTTLFSNEPVAIMVRERWGDVREKWRTSRMGRPARAAILAGLALLILFNLSWLLPTAFFLAAIYVMYLGIRALIFAFTGEMPGARSIQYAAATPLRTSPSAGQPQARAYARRPEPAARAAPRPRPRTASASDLRRLNLASFKRQPASQRLATYTGSLLLAAPVAIGVPLIVAAFMGQPLDRSPAAWSIVAWIGAASLLASWLVLSLGRLWATADEDAVLRRTTMLAAGAGFGALLAGMGTFLHVQPTELTDMARAPGLLAPQQWYADGAPSLPASMAYFALVFFLGRWWRLADPLRSSRVSIASVATLALFAVGAQYLVYYPQPWGIVTVTAIALATQVAAPYTPRDERQRLAAAEGMVI